MVACVCVRNDFWALLLGMALAFVVQSSSVVTSALIPLVAIAVLPVGKMLPITLGANIGTTVTSVLAALTIMTHGEGPQQNIPN